MLSIERRGTTQIGNTTWEFHGDDKDKNTFYITPIPQFVMNGSLPAIQIVELKTSGSDNGSGYCQFQVELNVPPEVKPEISQAIKTQFNVDNPLYQSLVVQAGTLVNLTYPDGNGGTTGTQANGTDFGSNNAIFQISLDIDQMKEIKGSMSAKGGSPFQVEYVVSVPSNMPAVTAELSFDATIAYNYEVTSHSHTQWAHSTTYTYDIKQLLSQSAASTITVNKVDPNLPQSVVDQVRDWATSVVQTQLAAEIKAALAIQASGSGTQSFSISDVSSFKETYNQEETIMWHIQPQGVLPSFVDLGLNTDQINDLEPTIDERRFVANVTPNVPFSNAGSNEGDVNAAYSTSDGKPKGNDSGVEKLKSLDVTIEYPTLTGSDKKTYSFTDNKVHTWEAAWDTTAQGVYTLDYVAVYENGQQVTGSKKNIDATTYTLGLDDIGTLVVKFNATRFFTSEKGVVDSLDVDFVFDIPESTPYLETFVLNAAKSSHQVTSLLKAPITTDYLYTLTYNFTADTHANPFTSNVKQENTQNVRVDAPDFEQSIPVVIHWGASANPDFIQFDVNFYYDGEPYFPKIPASAALPKPTQASPVTFSISSSTTPNVVDKLLVFANSKVSPLTLDAQGIASDGTTIQWGPLEFDSANAPNLAFFKDTLFTFAEINPEIVDWKITDGVAGLMSINIMITSITYTTATKAPPPLPPRKMGNNTQTIGWDPQVKSAPSTFIHLANLPADYSDISFDWVATYVYSDGSKYAKGTQAGTILNLPEKATDATQPTELKNRQRAA
jgi:hypothetical protein